MTLIPRDTTSTLIPRDMAVDDDPVVNQTVVEKGKLPLQLRKSQAEAFGLLDKALWGTKTPQQRRKEHWEFEMSRPDNVIGGAPEAALIAGGLNTIDTGMKAIPAMADLATYPLRQSFAGRMLLGTPDAERTPLVGPLYDKAPGANELMGAVTGTDAATVAADRQALGEAYPVSTGAAELGTDVLSLMTGKMPFTSKLGAMEGKAAERIHKAEVRVRRAKAKPVYSKLAAKENTIFKGPAAQRLKRWAGRTAEAGAEGFLFSAIKGGDPVEVGSITAGLQAGSSAVGSLAGHSFAHVAGKKVGGVVGFAVQVGAMSYLLQLGSKLLPGEDHSKRDYEAREAALNKTAIGYATAFVASVLGGRARTGRQAALRPKLTEAITSIPRHTMTGVVTKVLGKPEAEQLNMAQKLKALSSGDMLLSDDQLSEWNAIIEKGGEDMTSSLIKFLESI